MASASDMHGALNEAQRRAVFHTDGPLAVLAGPGTGKTRVICYRIARLIDEGADPKSIVALTFTNKAATQLREKLAGVLGKENQAKAQDVRAMTFHSFGQRLLRRFGDMAGIDASSQLIDGAQRKRLLREIILVHKLYPDGAGLGVDAAAERCESLIEQCANHSVSVAQAREYARTWRERLVRNEPPMDPSVRAGELAQVERFEVLVRLMELAAKECRARGWMSFGDLVTLPIELMRTSRLARDLIRGEIRHMVVDEFQDVNPSQIALVHEIMPASGKPDLCVVGDDDQTIYEFRGSDERAFAKFVKLWPGASTVKLEENHRSEQCILDVSNSVIGRSTERFAPDKRIVRPANMKSAKPGAVAKVIQLEHYADDAELIGAMLMQMRASEPDLPWSKYAVIARNNKDLDRVAMGLELEGIPVVRARPSPNEPGVEDVLAYIRMLLEPADIYAVRRILTRPPSLLPLKQVAAWECDYRSRASHAELGNPEVESPGTYLEWLAQTQSSVPQAVRLLEHHRELSVMCLSRPAGDVIARIVELSGTVHAELLEPRARARRVQSLVGFMRAARERADRIEQPGLLSQYWEYFNDLSEKEQEGIAPQERVEGAGEEAPLGEGVQLITAHSAKGLEFDTVFVTRVTPSHGFGEVRAREEGELPEALIDRAGDTRGPKQRLAAEQRRLFYVACTRAERRLVMMGEIAKKSESAHFLKELVEPGSKLTLEEAANVLEQASRAPVGDVERETRALRVAGDRRAVIERLRTMAREQAARALDSVDRLGTDAQAIASATARLEQSASELAILHALAKGMPTPKLSAASAGLIKAIEQELAKASDGNVAGVAGSASGLMPPIAPLKLSYTMVNDWERCPRCCYCKHVLQLPAPPSDEAALGTLVHEALSTFYERWMRADAEGTSKPATKELVELGRSLYFRARKGQPADGHELAALEAMLTSAHEKFHDDNAQILERPEWSVTVEIELPSGKHMLTAKIDRVEQLPSGGLRIVDYKTGKPHKQLVEPTAADPQMGTYALALDARLGNGTPVTGTAEYWVLSSGDRGVIALESIKRDKVRASLEKVASGLLSGVYPKGKEDRCMKLCDFLG